MIARHIPVVGDKSDHRIFSQSELPERLDKPGNLGINVSHVPVVAGAREPHVPLAHNNVFLADKLLDRITRITKTQPKGGHT